jgi:hypothetical protein
MLTQACLLEAFFKYPGIKKFVFSARRQRAGELKREGRSHAQQGAGTLILVILVYRGTGFSPNPTDSGGRPSLFLYIVYKR